MGPGLVDEFQIGVHSIHLGSGFPLFKNIQNRVGLEPIKTEKSGGGAVVVYYGPVKPVKAWLYRLKT